MNILWYSTSIWINDGMHKTGKFNGTPPLQIFYLNFLFGTVIKIILKIEPHLEKEIH